MGINNLFPKPATGHQETPGLGGWEAFVVLQHCWCHLLCPCPLLAFLMQLRNRYQIFPRRFVTRARTYSLVSKYSRELWICFKGKTQFFIEHHLNGVTFVKKALKQDCRAAQNMPKPGVEWVLARDKSHRWKYNILKNAFYFPEESWNDLSPHCNI